MARRKTTRSELVSAFETNRGDPVGGRRGVTGPELRRAIGFIDDMLFSVLVSDPRPRKPTHTQTASGIDGRRTFCGDPERLSLVKADGSPPVVSELVAFFDERVPSLQALSDIRVPPMKGHFVRTKQQLRYELTWDGGGVSVPVDGALIAEMGAIPAVYRRLFSRLDRQSPKLVKELSAIRFEPITAIAQMATDGVMSVDPSQVRPHRVGIIDHEVMHPQTAGDRELQFLTVVALKLGPPPGDQYADTSIDEVLPVHAERLATDPRSVLGQNGFLDRLVFALVIDPDFGPAAVRQAMHARSGRRKRPGSRLRRRSG